jgi:CheY-like chemotaxis protein
MTLSVLIVEDIRFTRAALARILRGIVSCTIHEAATGKTAIETLRDLGHIDLIIADVKMTEMTGLELLKFVRSGEAFIPYDTPFMLVSGAMTKDIHNTAEKLDVTGVIDKPLRREDLANLLAQLDAAAGTISGRTSTTYQHVDVAKALEPGPTEPTPKAAQLADVEAGVRLLESAPGLEGLNQETLQNLARHVQPHHYPSGTDVIVEGQSNRRLYLIESGEAEVLKASQLTDDDGAPHRLALLALIIHDSCIVFKGHAPSAGFTDEFGSEFG